MDLLTRRLEHAWGYRELFYEESRAFLDTHPYRVWDEHEPDSGDYLVWMEPTEPVPPRLGFLAGDCINNIRSPLDNLVSALPGAAPDRAAFVILPTDPALDPKPTTFAQKAWRLKGIPQAAIDLIESLQPYKGTKDASGVNIPIGELLLWLDRLWNMDKHRLPTVTTSFTQTLTDYLKSNLGSRGGEPEGIAFTVPPVSAHLGMCSIRAGWPVRCKSGRLGLCWGTPPR